LAACGVLAAPLIAWAAPAWADDPAKLNLTYTLDAVSVDGGRLRVLDKLLAVGEATLRPGLKGRISALEVSGAHPNLSAGTLQGVDNIEVVRHRGRLFESWLQQDLGHHASLRAGLQDLNLEFYATDSTDLFVSPTFGIGAEMGASGVNGPAIFPSSALGARLRLEPAADLYAQAAAFDAKAGGLGDPGGVDLGFHEGLLLAAQAGWTGHGQVALGAWRYTRRQRPIPADPDPAWRFRSQGVYALVEQPLGPTDARAIAFLRAGIAQAAGLPMRAAMQAGVTVKGPLANRPDGRFAVGVGAAWPSARLRRLTRDAGARPRAEQLVEVTYADRVAPHLSLQPDLQLLRHGGARAGRDEAVMILRLTAAW